MRSFWLICAASPVCSVVRVPTPETRIASGERSERERLLKERTGHSNRSGTAACQGIREAMP